MSVNENLVALYIRVSTEAQADEGYSIPAQKERLSGFCQAKGWKNIECYIDGGYSGSNLERPQIQRLIQDVKDKKVNTVIVFKLDRLSRSQKDTLYLIEDIFLPNDVDFISLNESIDTSTPYGRAMIGILSAFAQLERENIFLRTRMGMLERVKAGFWPGGGNIPFGYDYDKKSGILIPNEDAATVRKIFELYLQGYSAQKIAEMTERKSDVVIMQILQRKSSLGLIPFKGEVYKGNHQPIIDAETFARTQIQIQQRGEKARVTVSAAHLLTGLIYCGECGARMRYIKNGNNGYRLMCYSKDRSKPYMHRTTHCDSEYIDAEQIEDIVLSDLFSISLDWSSHQKSSEQVDPLVELKKQISQLENKIQKLYNLFAETSNDILLRTIEENNKKLETLKKSYEDEEKSNKKKEYIVQLKDKIIHLKDIWEYLNDKEKQLIVRDCIEKIVLKKDSIEIRFTFKQTNSKKQII